MIRTPETFVPILGRPFIAKLTDNTESPALRIGRDTWSRHEVATKLGIVNIMACSILSGICRKLAVTSTKELYERTSPYTFAEYRCGVTTLYAMFAAFRDKGLAIDEWYHKKEGGALVSFQTLKHRELEAEKKTVKTEKKRRGGKRPTGGEGTVSRYLSNRV